MSCFCITKMKCTRKKLKFLASFFSFFSVYFSECHSLRNNYNRSDVRWCQRLFSISFFIFWIKFNHSRCYCCAFLCKDSCRFSIVLLRTCTHSERTIVSNDASMTVSFPFIFTFDIFLPRCHVIILINILLTIHAFSGDRLLLLGRTESLSTTSKLYSYFFFILWQLCKPT